MKIRTMLLIPALLSGALAMAQQDEDQSSTDSATETSQRESGEEDLDSPSAAPQDENPDAVPDDPLAETEAQEQRQLEASMERFDPSEEISEDRSVAFPNDI